MLGLALTGRLLRNNGLFSKISRFTKICSDSWATKYQQCKVLKQLNKKCLDVRPGVLLSVVTVHCLSFSGWGKKSDEVKQKTPEKTAAASTQLLIQQADDLYENNEIHKLYDLLRQHAESDNDELLWRLSRAACDKGKMSSDAEFKKACIYEAFGYIKRALELNKENFACHKWYAILLDYTGEYEGTKKRIENAYLVKEHFLRAVELNPKDATSIYSIGYWCFLFADMPWYTKKIASAVFATPPSSTYEEALKYFELAEKVDPGFYSMNLLMMGKTFLRLKQTETAREFLIRARECPVIRTDDQKAHDEAIQLLKSLGIKD